MIFYSKASNLRIQLRKGGFQPSEDVPGTYDSVPGEYAQFEGGQFDTSRYMGRMGQEDIIAKLRKHPDYGYGREFWAEVDRPESVRMEDELVTLRAEVEALRKATAKEIVVVDKSAPVDKPKEMNDLREKAKELGIQAKRDWKREDYERAISAVTKEE